MRDEIFYIAAHMRRNLRNRLPDRQVAKAHALPRSKPLDLPRQHCAGEPTTQLWARMLLVR